MIKGLRIVERIVRKPFYALNKREVLLGVGVTGVGLTFALGTWLCPLYGVNGLVAALSISTSVQLLVYMGVVRRYVPSGLGLFALSKYFLIVAMALLPSVGIGLLLMPYGDWQAGFTILNIVVLTGGSLAAFRM